MLPMARRQFLQLFTAGAVATAAGFAPSAWGQSTRGIEGRKAPELELDYWMGFSEMFPELVPRLS